MSASVRTAVSAGALAMAAALALGQPAEAGTIIFNPNDLVVSVYGQGAVGDLTNYTDNSATPITLQQLSLSGISSSGIISSGSTATTAGQLVLPQTGGNGQNPISGEFGSSSEGILQQSADGRFLTIAGYAVQASAYNAAPASFGGTTKSCIGAPGGSCFPLAQTPSSTVPRVVALVGSDGSVDTSTTLGTAFSGNNPRSVTTADGSSFYVSGQNTASKKNVAGQGVVYATRGSNTSTTIDDSYETRVVTIHNGQLYVSADTTEGSGVHETVASYNGLPTSAASASTLGVSTSSSTNAGLITSKFAVLSTSQLNTLDAASGSGITAGTKIYLSPEQYFFASPTVLYIADSGNPKGDNNGPNGAAQGLSDGGLQKWVMDPATGAWSLEYTISAGLNLVPDTASCTANQTNCGTTGLIGLTGKVVGDEVELFATNATLGDLDPTFLYGVSDQLDATSLASGEGFTELYAAGPDQIIRGVAFAPVPEPATWAMMLIGLGGLGALLRGSRRGRTGAIAA